MSAKLYHENEIDTFEMGRTDDKVIRPIQLRATTDIISFDELKLSIDLASFGRDIRFKINRNMFMRSKAPAIPPKHYEKRIDNRSFIDIQNARLYSDINLDRSELDEIKNSVLSEYNGESVDIYKRTKLIYPNCKPYFNCTPKGTGIKQIYIQNAQLVVVITGKIVASTGNLGLISNENITTALNNIKATGLLDFNNEAFIRRAFVLVAHVTVDIDTDDVNSLYKAISSYLPVRTSKYYVIPYKTGFHVRPRGKSQSYEFCIYNKGIELTNKHYQNYKKIIGVQGLELAKRIVRFELRLYSWSTIRTFLIDVGSEAGSITLRQALNSTQQPIRRMLSLLDINETELISARGTAIANASEIDTKIGHADYLKMFGVLKLLELNNYDLLRVRDNIELETAKKLPTSFMSGMRDTLQRYIACFIPRTIQVLEALLQVVEY